MPDTNDKIRELYGCPLEHGQGWGIIVYPTQEQSTELQKLHEAACDQGNYTTDHLKGKEAVSFDKPGRERAVTITDGYSRGGAYDMYGNETIQCKCEPRNRAPAGPARKALTHDGDAGTSPPPTRPANRYAGAAAAARADGLPPTSASHRG